MTIATLQELVNGLRAALASGSRPAIDQTVERLFAYDRQNQGKSGVSAQLKSDLFLLKAQSRLKKGDAAEALNLVVRATRLAPYSAKALKAFEQLVASRRSEPAQTVALIISCGKYQKKAIAMAERINGMPGVDYRIVMGREADVTAVGKLIKVRASDTYEALPHKIRDAFFYAYRTFAAGTNVIKLDDDLEISDLDLLARGIRDLSERGCDYAGIPVDHVGFDRDWHQGKCNNELLNAAIYGKRFYGPWANGPFYYLSAEALRRFCLASIRFPNEIDGELYEDKFVGDTLRLEGIELTPIDPNSFGIMADNFNRMETLKMPPLDGAASGSGT